MFLAGPSCKGCKIRGQTHGKNQEGKQQTVQTIGRKNSGFPDHENRTYSHYFGNFGKQIDIANIHRA